MARHSAVTARMLKVASIENRGESIGERLNRRVLKTLHELAEEITTDPGIEDEYEFELFENPRPGRIKKKT